ncbi:MAG: tRNA lysidine(34) synthetase TilS, partial [Deltaproteobacteria bacterium]|nr:tRNA lysidine(34) synthetase TilS [Deltaproteobacteria bacterium]
MNKFRSFFLSKLIKTVKDSSLLAWGEKVIVAVSGGVDSAVLLYCLYELRHYFGINPACASFDHKIRPSSREDILFVSGLCKKFSLPFYTKEADVKDYAKRLKLNLEESARILRYNFLMESALDFGAGKIATAHHLDDFAENFIMRLTIGGGGGALAGIPVKNNTIIRPLIRHAKREIIDFARDNSIKFREDYTNYDERIFRNFVRLNIIPQLKKHNKSFLKTVYNTSEILKSDDEFINVVAKDLFDNASKLFFSKTGDDKPLLSQIVFNGKDLINKHPALLYRLLKISILSLGQFQDILGKSLFSIKPVASYSNFKAFVELVKSKKPNTYFNIKHLISVRREYDKIFIEHISPNNKLTFKSFSFNFT